MGGGGGRGGGEVASERKALRTTLACCCTVTEMRLMGRERVRVMGCISGWGEVEARYACCTEAYALHQIGL